MNMRIYSPKLRAVTSEEADCLPMMLMFSNTGTAIANPDLLHSREKIQFAGACHIPSISPFARLIHGFILYAYINMQS